MDIRQLDALLAIAEEGSFTAAADRLHTVQSNVSEHVRQLEQELGVQLLVRSRSGAVPTEFGERVLDRARAIRSELEALRTDLSMLAGLETGQASLGVVGTVSRWVVPPLVAQMRAIAPGVSLRITEGASERIAAEVAGRELAFALVTEPVAEPRLVVEHLSDEVLVGIAPARLGVGPGPVTLADFAAHPLILPPAGNPLRDEVDDAARAERVALSVSVEVEGIRLIGDLVAAGEGVSIVPETSIEHPALERVTIARVPPRRLGIVRARGVQLSLADQAVHDIVVQLVRARFA